MKAIADRLFGDLTAAGLAAFAIFVAVLLVLPGFANSYVLTVGTIVLYLAFVGQAWNLMLGYAGLLSIGHALFMGIGAYASAYLFARHGLPPLVGLVAGVGLAVGVGAAIGYLGFRFAIGGVYFALLTIAFAEFTRIMVDHARFLGGTEGLFLPVSAESRQGFDLFWLRGRPEMYYYVILVLCLGAHGFCRWLLTGRTGFYWRAVRDNPQAAEALGVNIFRYRMYAVMVSAGMAAVAGVFYAFFYNNLFPEQIFSVERSIEMSLAPIVGGVGTLFGPIFGAFVLTPLGELLTWVIEWLQEQAIIGKQVKVDGVKLLFWGIAVAAIVLLQPRGLWPWACRRLGLIRPPEERDGGS